MKSYLVGGAVRDKLLNLPIKDKDWVVVGGSAEELRQQGFLQVGKGFPVFLHPDTKQEYALARTERKSAPGHTGFEFDASAGVTLEQDLMRRDLTINAMAETEGGELIDPYQGQRDIEQRVLRHVSPAFSEDPLRVLRVARFAARFAHLGFTVADETMLLMRDIVASGEMDHLVKERIWREIELALVATDPSSFVRTLRDCHALKVILPEVDRLFGVPQPAKYHPEIDTGIHVLMCLQQVSKLTADPVVRYATLVHDVGKGVTDSSKWPSHYGHEKLGLKLLSDITSRLRVPNAFSQLAAIVCEHHTKLHRVRELRPTTLLKLIEAIDAIRRPERMEKFLLACEADSRGRAGLEEQDYPQGEYLAELLRAVMAIDIPELLERHKPDKTREFVQEQRLKALEQAVQKARANQSD